MKRKVLLMVVMAGLLLLPVMAQDMGKGKGKGKGNNYRKGNPKGFNGGMSYLLLNLPKETLNVQEKKGLKYMREEEKLARDVYLTMDKTWNYRIFSNIAYSEQRHMDAIKVLLDKYELKDPVTDNTVGVFTDPHLQSLYHELVNSGSVSFEEALRVGALIEDLDIFDLKGYLLGADNSDVKTLYQNLLKGSRNHMRAFVPLLESQGEEYTAQYLSQEEVDEIVNSPMERGIVDENGDPIFGNFGW